MRLTEVAEKNRVDLLAQLLQGVLNAWSKLRKRYYFEKPIIVQKVAKSDQGPYARIEMSPDYDDGRNIDSAEADAFMKEVNRIFKIAEDQIGFDNLLGFDLQLDVFGPKTKPLGALIRLTDPTGPKTPF